MNRSVIFILRCVILLDLTGTVCAFFVIKSFVFITMLHTLRIVIREIARSKKLVEVIGIHELVIYFWHCDYHVLICLCNWGFFQ